jgi:uracil phosphoribosyltransferase
MKAIELRHPLVHHKLAYLREESLDPVRFRQIAGEIGMMLAYEACRDLALADARVATWSGPLDVKLVRSDSVTLVPILRAGLGFLPGVQAMLPNAPVSVVGLRRNEQTLQPESYYTRLVDRLEQRTALLLDPMLATGGSVVAAVDLLKRSGCRRIKGLFLVAAPEGLARVEAAHPDVEIYVASIDRGLDARGYILPGLGDAGDRLFGTPVD